MILTYHEVNQLPIAIIDNLYDKTAEENIMQELLFLNNDTRKLRDPEFTGSAWTPDETVEGGKKWLKQNKAISLDEIYAGGRDISNILLENRKIFSPEVCEQLIEAHNIFRYVKFANRDATLVSYYENSDYYLPHRDDATMTAITWFYQTPKAFNGGDLLIEDTVKVECKHNRCVIFPSVAWHSVDEIIIQENQKNMNMGRFAISQFISFQI